MKRPEDRVTDCVVEEINRYYIRVTGKIPLEAGALVEEACRDNEKIGDLIDADGRPDPHSPHVFYKFAGFHEVK